MYNFYNLNPNHNTSSKGSTSEVTLDVNTDLNNETFYKLFADYYYDNASEEKQDILAQHLNTINYLIAFFPSDSSIDPRTLKSVTIHTMEDLNLLISTTEDREVYLPVFNDNNELQRWSTEPVFTLSVPAKWLWQFTLSQKNFTGIVFNPGSIGWNISLEHIQSLLDDINNK